MRFHLACAVFVLFCSACNPATETPLNPEVPTENESTSVRTESPDDTPRVTGIGGIFFKSDDPAAVNAWYAEQLGLKVDPFGSPFAFRNYWNPEALNYLRWGNFETGTDYFDPSNRDYMINYRVHRLEALVSQLEAAGTAMMDTVQVTPYGKFVHFVDPFGVKVELWEPVDSVLTGFGTPTTK